MFASTKEAHEASKATPEPIATTTRSRSPSPPLEAVSTTGGADEADNNDAGQLEDGEPAEAVEASEEQSPGKSDPWQAVFSAEFVFLSLRFGSSR
jgi:hypothetical protein